MACELVCCSIWIWSWNKCSFRYFCFAWVQWRSKELQSIECLHFLFYFFIYQTFNWFHQSCVLFHVFVQNKNLTMWPAFFTNYFTVLFCQAVYFLICKDWEDNKFVGIFLERRNIVAVEVLPTFWLLHRFHRFLLSKYQKGFIHLVRMHNLPKKNISYTPDKQTYVYVSGGKNDCFSENFAYVINKWSQIVLSKSEGLLPKKLNCTSTG